MNDRETYAELACHDGPRLCEPVSRQDNIRLRGDGLWELEEYTGCLRQALCRIKDHFLKVIGKGTKAVPQIQLLGARQRVRHVPHLRPLVLRRDNGPAQQAVVMSFSW